MGIKRTEGWEHRLFEFLQAAARRPFSWGEWDCCKFVHAALEVQAEATIPHPNYKTKRGALRIIKRHGGFQNMISALAKDLELELVAPLLAQRGDVVMVDEGEFLVGICAGSNIVVVAEDGLITKPITEGVWACRLP